MYMLRSYICRLDKLRKAKRLTAYMELGKKDIIHLHGTKGKAPTYPSHQPSGTVKPSKIPKSGNLEKETSSPYLSFEFKGFPGSKIPSSISQFTVV